MVWGWGLRLMAALSPQLVLRPNIWPSAKLSASPYGLGDGLARLGPWGRMLAPSMELEGSRPSLRAPRHSNGPTISTKMAGANIVSMRDGNPHAFST